MSGRQLRVPPTSGTSPLTHISVSALMTRSRFLRPRPSSKVTELLVAQETASGNARCRMRGRRWYRSRRCGPAPCRPAVAGRSALHRRRCRRRRARRCRGRSGGGECSGPGRAALRQGVGRHRRLRHLGNLILARSATGARTGVGRALRTGGATWGARTWQFAAAGRCALGATTPNAARPNVNNAANTTTTTRIKPSATTATQPCINEVANAGRVNENEAVSHQRCGSWFPPPRPGQRLRQSACLSGRIHPANCASRRARAAPLPQKRHAQWRVPRR